MLRVRCELFFFFFGGHLHLPSLAFSVVQHTHKTVLNAFKGLKSIGLSPPEKKLLIGQNCIYYPSQLRTDPPCRWRWQLNKLEVVVTEWQGDGPVGLVKVAPYNRNPVGAGQCLSRQLRKGEPRLAGFEDRIPYPPL